MPTIAAPILEHICDLAVTISAPVEVGMTPQGLRRMIPITGGTLSGPRLRGKVLAGGADYQLIIGGTTAHLDAQYVIELEDGARVFVRNTALRHATAEATARLVRGERVDASEIYFRCQPRFETAAPAWAWLNESQFVGSGVRLPDAVHMSFYRLG